MYIKKVTIEGFKSFRGRTVVEFKRGLNIIIGQNGSGKSNLFEAIQFLVCHDYLHMVQKKKEELLNAGIQQKPFGTASVEIVFEDENDGRSVETVLKREVSRGRDALYCDGKATTKEQFISTLSTAGISKIDSHFIIKQGNTSQLTQASDAVRLKLMKEAAGASVWEELKPLDIAMIDDAKAQLGNCEKLFAEMEKNLDSLKTEKEEYEEWKIISNSKKLLELCIIRKNRSHQIKKMERCVESARELQAKTHKTSMEVEELSHEKTSLHDRLDSLTTDLENAQGNLVELRQSFTKSGIQDAQLELEIKERERNVQRRNDEASLMGELVEVEEKIQKKISASNDITAEYDTALKEKCELKKKCIFDDERLKELRARLVQTESFANQEARDASLNHQVESLAHLLEKEKNDLNLLTQQLDKDIADRRNLEARVQELETEKRMAFDKLKEYKKQKVLSTDDLRRVQFKQNELRREESAKVKHLNECSKHYARKVVEFSKVTSKSLADAIETVGTAVTSMLGEGADSPIYKLACGYRGVVIDQFTCEESLFTTIHAIAGDRLFDHVVDNEDVASAILDRIELMGLPGAPKLIAHNQLQRRDPLPEKENAIPILNSLKANEGMEALLDKFFAKWMLCSNMDAACRSAQELNCNCATLQGQTVRDSGAIRGGHYGQPRLRLELYKDIVKVNKDVELAKQALEVVRVSLRKTEEENSTLIGRLQKTESAIEKVGVGKIIECLENCKQRLALLADAIRGKEEQKRTVSLSIDSTLGKIEALKQQLHQAFTPELSEAESEEMITLRERIIEGRASLRNAEERCRKLNVEKTKVESELGENLMRRKQDLERSLNDLLLEDNIIIPFGTNNSDDRSANFLDEMKQHWESLKSHLAQQSQEIDRLVETVDMYKRDAEETKRNVRKIGSKLDEKRQLLKEQLGELSKVNEQIQVLEAKKEEYSDKLADITATDDEEIKRYMEMTLQQLETELASVNRKLKGFTSLNMRAGVDYDAKQQKLKELKDKSAMHKESNDKCRELINQVDQAKSNALQYSLNQIATGFESMFSTIVPRPGWGKLRWIYDEVDGRSSEEESSQPGGPDMERLIGVAIDISFRGGSKVRNIRCLSGGQRSLISLSLVFAILLMDRAPFYLLDEADMALDVNYREAIAEKINELARESQFIVTTFRPEMLEFADNIIKVSYNEASSTSHCGIITKEVAKEFVSRCRTGVSA